MFLASTNISYLIKKGMMPFENTNIAERGQMGPKGSNRAKQGQIGPSRAKWGQAGLFFYMQAYFYLAKKLCFATQALKNRPRYGDFVDP